MPPVKKEGAAGKRAGKRAPAKRKLAEEFAPGEVLTDLAKKQWKLGAPIGQGGFGRLYLADENSSKPVGRDAPYVIKVEPSDNGPLFTELKFYMRAAKPDQIQKWISSHNLKYLGVPKYWGSGLYIKNGNSYRFMVMDRFGKDLHKIYEENGKQFTHKTVLQLGLRLLEILEYIHEHEYVHGDIKASNLLLSYRDPNQVYLVDYGLAYRYCPDGVHREYKEDPKKCHDGTIEYTSIDAHRGVAPSRRGDLEILGYCMIQWLGVQLPWEDNLKNPDFVKEAKINFSDEVSPMMAKWFPQKKPEELSKYMLAVYELGYSARPPYARLREILLQGLEANGYKNDGKLDFMLVESNGGVPPHRERQGKQKREKLEESTELESSETNILAKKKEPGLSLGKRRANSSKPPSPAKRQAGVASPARKRVGVPSPTTKILSPAVKRAVVPARGSGRNLASMGTGKPSGRGRGRGRGRAK